jgi:HAD superfamily hydrolase (TIGR01484 family)
MQFPKPKLIISDFDGTMTHGHKLTQHFPQILELCQANDIPFIVHTGRSISWAHFLVTHYDEIPFALAEGGGVYVGRDDRHLLKETYLVTKEERAKLAKVAGEVVEKFDIGLSVDSLGRITDRAIELRDLADRDESVVEEIKKYFTENGVTFSQSNVHVNFWVGDVDKYKGLQFFLKNEYPDVTMEDVWFFGDSMNDEPMFEKLPYAVGVSNIIAVMDKLSKPPTVVLEGFENEGPMGVLNFLKSNLK